MNAELARYKLKRLLSETEPKDYSELDGFLGSLAILMILALGLYVAGVLVILMTGQQ